MKYPHAVKMKTDFISQLAFTCSKLTIEALEQGKNYHPSYQ